MVIPFRRKNPHQVFCEIKDNTHPLALLRGGLCLIGGNWIGASVINDQGPLGTVRREIREELTLQPKAVSTEEPVDLGLADHAERYATFRMTHTATDHDQTALTGIVETITASLTPFGSRLNTVTAEAIRASDPNCMRESFTTLSCYWVAPLDEPTWEGLHRFQAAYHNLSNESIALITSLDEILERDFSGAFAHEHAPRDFSLAMGLSRAKDTHIVPHQTSEEAGPPLSSYAEYLERCNIAKKPV